MPEFKPDKAMKTKIISLIILWGKNLEAPKGASKLHKPKIKTKEVVRMLNALPGPSVTFDVLKKYWENIPAIQNRIVDLNKDTITYRTEEESPDQVPEVSPEPPPADTEMPVDQQADQSVEPPGQATIPAPEPEAAPAAQPEAEPDRLQGSRSIVSQMAKRAKSRAIK